MTRVSRLSVVFLVSLGLLLVGCATVPSGPSRPAMMGANTPPHKFAADDQYCRGVAQNRAGAIAANANNATAGTALGTAAGGAALGALAGGGRGAGIGAAAGLLAGLFFSAASASAASDQGQVAYNAEYGVCMCGMGHTIPGVCAAAAPMPPPPPPPPPPGAYAPAPSADPAAPCKVIGRTEIAGKLRNICE